jgi:hypothetical protein
MSTYRHAYINILAYFNALLTSTHTCACMYVCYTLVKWVGTWSSDTASCVHICAYMQPCMHVYAHAFIHAYLHAYMLGVHDAPAYMHTLTTRFVIRTCIHVHENLHEYICMHIGMRMHCYAGMSMGMLHNHTCIHLHAHLHADVCIYYIHAYIRPYTHTHAYM